MWMTMSGSWGCCAARRARVLRWAQDFGARPPLRSRRADASNDERVEGKEELGSRFRSGVRTLPVQVGRESISKVSHYGKIDNENQDFDRTEMAVYLVNLNWNEGAGDDYGEPLSPTSHHPETDAL